MILVKVKPVPVLCEFDLVIKVYGIQNEVKQVTEPVT